MALETPELLITTGQAAELVGRSQYAVRGALSTGVLRSAARTEQGQHRLRPTDVLTWARTHPAKPMPIRRAWEQTAAALAALGGSASADELAAYVQLHPGNARKHLLILAAQGRVERCSDGQWILTDSHVGAA